MIEHPAGFDVSYVDDLAKDPAWLRCEGQLFTDVGGPAAASRSSGVRLDSEPRESGGRR